MTTTFTVERNIESLDEIIDEVPAGTITIICVGKELKSLRGIERLPSVTELYAAANRITSLEGLAGSNVTRLSVHFNLITSLKDLTTSNVTILDISYNQIASLKDLAGTNVTKLYISYNPCYEQFRDEFEGSVQRVKDYYNQFIDIPKNPGFD